MASAYGHWTVTSRIRFIELARHAWRCTEGFARGKRRRPASIIVTP
jgi:hypothetical protein